MSSCNKFRKLENVKMKKFRPCQTSLNVQPSNQYVGVCDGMRVLSIGIVAWFHIWQQSWLWPEFNIWGHEINLDPIIRSGYMWVDLMILISGFCLYLPWARLQPHEPSPDAMLFYTKRIARIVPSYVLNVLIVFVFSYAAGFYAEFGRAIRDLLMHLTFSQVFSYETYYATPINAGLWTIAIEMHFYLLFPFIAHVFRRTPFLTAAVMISVSLSFRAWIGANIKDIAIWFNQLIAYLDVFALGMLFAKFHVRLCRIPHRLWLRLICSVMALLSFLMLLKLGQAQSRCPDVNQIRLGQMQRRFFMGFFGAVMLLALAHSNFILRVIFENRVTKLLSRISMQFYIWHQVIAVQILRSRWIPSIYENPNYESDRIWQQRYTLVVWLFSLVVAVVLTFLFEQPIATRILSKYQITKIRKQNSRIISKNDEKGL